MDVWQLANSLAVTVFEMTIHLPRNEDYALTSQIRRSSNGVGASIAEGFGRKTKKDKAYFYTVSRGSALETQHHLMYGSNVKYFEKGKVEEMIVQYDDLIHQLNKIIKSLN